MLKEFRKKEIDLINVVLCTLVVFIHITSEAVQTLRIGTWQHLFVYIPNKLSSFVVYGFIFISAIKLFIKDTEKIKLLEYYKKRIKSIILPYVFAVLIYYIYFISKKYFDFSMLELIKYIGIGDLVAHFYFIIIISQFYLLFPVWKKITKHLNIFIAIGFSLVITLCFTKYLPNWIDYVSGFNFIYNDRVFTTYLFYWICGVYVGKNYGDFRKLLAKYEKSIVTLFLCFCFVYLAINYSFVVNRNFVNYLNVLQMIYNILAILFVYFICVKLSDKNKLIDIIEPVNKNSYSIYLYHILIIFMLNEVLNKFNIVDVAGRLIIKTFVVYFIIVGISFLKSKRKYKKRLSGGV